MVKVEWGIIPQNATKSHGPLTGRVTSVVKNAGKRDRPGQDEERGALKLTRGHYALICNLKGHWNNGQFVDYYLH